MVEMNPEAVHLSVALIETRSIKAGSSGKGLVAVVGGEGGEREKERDTHTRLPLCSLIHSPKRCALTQRER